MVRRDPRRERDIERWQAGHFRYQAVMAATIRSWLGGKHPVTIKSVAGVLRTGLFSLAEIVVGTYNGAPWLSDHSARSIETTNLDQTQCPIAVAATTSSTGSKFSLSDLQSLEARRSNAQAASLIMADKTAETTDAEGTVQSYRVIHSTSEMQYIETMERDDDITLWCRYVATRDAVIPLWTKNCNPGYMLSAFAYSLLLALSLNLLGRLMVTIASRGQSAH